MDVSQAQGLVAVGSKKEDGAWAKTVNIMPGMGALIRQILRTRNFDRIGVVQYAQTPYRRFGAPDILIVAAGLAGSPSTTEKPPEAESTGLFGVLRLHLCPGHNCNVF